MQNLSRHRIKCCWFQEHDMILVRSSGPHGHFKQEVHLNDYGEDVHMMNKRPVSLFIGHLCHGSEQK